MGLKGPLTPLYFIFLHPAWVNRAVSFSLLFHMTCSRSHMTSEKRAAELISAIELPKFYAPQTVMATGSIREGGTYEKDSSM